MNNYNWTRIDDKSLLCPICGKDSWCGVWGDPPAAVICMRVAKGSKKRTRNDGFLHILRPDVWRRSHQQSRRRHRGGSSVRYKPIIPDGEGKQAQFLADCCKTDIDFLANELGVSAESLVRLGTGVDLSRHVFTWPMRSSDGRIIGFRTRCPNSGAKRAVPGSRNGLFIPNQLSPTRVLLVVEGPSDTAAALTAGCEAVGRSDAYSYREQVAAVTKANRPDRVIVVADRDEVGQSNARQLCRYLHAFVAPTTFMVPPTPHKDLRDWVRAGATASDITEDLK